MSISRFLIGSRTGPQPPPLAQAPADSFEFQPCGRTPPIFYLIPFAPLAFAPPPVIPGYDREPRAWRRQSLAFATGVPPDLYAFHRYTRNSTLPSRRSRPSFRHTREGGYLGFGGVILSLRADLFPAARRLDGAPP